jgi:hypothetical protein
MAPAAFLMHDLEGVDDHVGEFGVLARARDDLRRPPCSR